MKTTMKVLATGAVLAALAGPMAAEAAVNVDVVIGVPGSTAVAPQPVYYYPPQVVYAPAPRFVRHHHERDWYRHHRYEDRRYWR